MYFDYAREKAGQFASFLLDEHFTADRVNKGDLTIEQLQEYVTSVQDSVRKWNEIHFPSRATALGEEVRRCLERLARLGCGAFAPLMMTVMQKSANDAELIDFLAASERFVLVVSRLCRRRSDTGDSEFYRLAGRLCRNKATVAEATQSLDIEAAYYFSSERASTEMRDLFQRREGFYSWEGLRFFLFEYEQNLREQAAMGSGRLNWDEFNTSKKDHVTIEHIYPVSPVAGEWAAFETRPEAERGRVRNSLGNLLALSQSRNSKFSNRAFSTKKQAADGVGGYFNGSYSELSVAQCLEWTPQSVLDRGLLMLDFLELRWDVCLGSRAEKLKLLNLEFLKPAGDDSPSTVAVPEGLARERGTNRGLLRYRGNTKEVPRIT